MATMRRFPFMHILMSLSSTCHVKLLKKSQILCHYLAYLPFGDILIFYVCVKLRPYILTFQALFFV